MISLVRPVLVLFSLLTVLTGLAYPLLVTGIGRWAFPHQTSGSLVMSGGVIVGSSSDRAIIPRSQVFLGASVGHVPHAQ